jgi:hypothetical protein
MSGWDSITRWFRRAKRATEDEAGGAAPVATPPQGALSSELDDDADRETSTNAQLAGAADEPWPGNE